MKNSKIKVAKIILFILLIFILIFNLISTKSYAATVIIDSDSEIINDDEIFNYKLRFDSKMVTFDFILEYDADYIEFLGVNTPNVEYSELEYGKVIVLYVDEEGNGTNNIDINFKANKDKFTDDTRAKIKAIDINAYSVTKGHAYSSKDFDLSMTKMEVMKIKKGDNSSDDKDYIHKNDQNSNNVGGNGSYTYNYYYYYYNNNDSNVGNIKNDQNKNNTSNNNEIDGEFFYGTKTNTITDGVGAIDNNDDTKKDGQLLIFTPEPPDENEGDIPFTGTRTSKIATLLLVLLIIHTIYVFFKSRNNKMNFYMAFALGLILFGAVDSNAAGNIFIRNYDRIKNFENIIIVMPDLQNRNVNKSDFVAIQNSNNLNILKVTDKNADIIGNDELITTGSNIYTSEKKNYKVLLYGDVNCDGNINSNDIAEIIVHKLNNVELEGIIRKAANVYNENDIDDKEIDGNDIEVIKKYILRTLRGNLVNSFPEELPKGISIIYEKSEMDVRQEQQLRYIVDPSNMTVDDVEWTSNNEKIATVDENGKVTAKGSGTVYITAMSKSDSVLNDTISIKVADIPTNVRMHLHQIQFELGETRQLGATVEPATAKNKNVLWSTSNASIVSVDQTGKITAVNEGTATIKVTTEEGRLTDTCEVIVYEQDVTKPGFESQVQGIKINKASTTLKKGETEQLEASVFPSTAMFQGVSWKSSNPEVATVSSKGKVKAISSGMAVITVKSNDGGFTDTCVVTVDKINVTGISLNKTSIRLNNGETETLIPTVRPSDATNKEVVWSTANSLVATVVDGKVTARGAGVTTISAKTKDGGRVAVCAVQVNPTNVTGIELDRQDVAIYVDKSLKITATVTPVNADNKNVIWESSNEDIFTVDAFGNITGVSRGTATLTARTADGNKTATCRVTVIEEEIHVESIKLNRNQIIVKEGEFENLTTTITPESATNKNVTWTSSNPTVAEVDSNGKVLGKKEGLSLITVKTQDGYKTATCEVTVTKVVKPVMSVSLNKTTLTLNENESETLVATIDPIDADNRNVTWRSINTRIAEVDSNGKITAKEPGKTTIIVTTEYGGKTATCDVIVNKVFVPVTSVSLNKTSITLEKNQKEILLANIEPENADNKELRWTSSDTAIATVEQNGEVTARGAGNAIITVETVDGNKTATCNVTVNREPKRVTDINLNKTILNLEINQTETLVAQIAPIDADNKNVTWTSSNPEVATVEQNGEVTAKGYGNTFIRVTTEDGEKTATCEVTVKEEVIQPEVSVYLDKNDVELKVGEKAEVAIIVTPEDIPGERRYRVPTYNSSLMNIVISETGIIEIEGLKEGTTELEIETTVNGEIFHLSCNVTIKKDESLPEPEITVALNPEKMELEVGQEKELAIVVIPENSWAVALGYNDNNIIEIRKEDGKIFVVGKKAGTATINATIVVDGKEYIRTCEVIVTGSEAPEEILVSIDKRELELEVGESSDITINVTPQKAMEYEVSYISEIISVEPNSNIIKVTGEKAGTSELRIKVKVEGKEYDLKCNVTVKKASKLKLLKRLFKLD